MVGVALLLVLRELFESFEEGEVGEGVVFDESGGVGQR